MTKTRPLVSIVMPTRNRASVLPRALGSVLGQTVEDWELIIVDDASTDGTREVVAGFARVDSRIRVRRMDQPIGAAAARNIGVRNARGQLVAFIDDDDEWHPEKLSLQIMALQSAAPKAGLVHSQFVEVAADGTERLQGSYCAADDHVTRALCRGNFIGHSSVVVNRALLHTVRGFDERLPRLQDWDLWIRLSMRTPFVYVPEPLARIHISPMSISTSDSALLRASNVFLLKYESTGILPDAALADLLHTLGGLLLRAGVEVDGRTLRERAIRTCPSLWQRLQLRLVCLIGHRPERVVAALHGRSIGLLQHVSRSTGLRVVLPASGRVR